MFSRVRRIAILSPTLEGGGAEKVVCSVASALSASGFKIDLLLMKAEGALLPDVDPAVQLFDLGAGRAVRSIIPVARYLRSERPDVLLCGLEHANVVGLVSRIIANVQTRLVITAHCFPMLSRKYSSGLRVRLLESLARILYRQADLVVAVSSGVAQDLKQSRGVSERRLRVIHNPIQTAAVLEQARETIDDPWFSNGAEPVVLSLGRLVPEKHHRDLISAFKLVEKRCAARLVIVGDGPLRSSLEDQVERLNLTHCVRFLGFEKNPYRYLARAALSVLTTRIEGFGNVIVESLLLGVPIVAIAGSGGPDEILENGRYGKLVPAGDINALAYAMERSLAGARDPFGLRDRAACFSESRIIPQYVAAIESLFE
jgi:glycosyltransferase involved in cell wall biosynthesis